MCQHPISRVVVIDRCRDGVVSCRNTGLRGNVASVTGNRDGEIFIAFNQVVIAGVQIDCQRWSRLNSITCERDNPQKVAERPWIAGRISSIKSTDRCKHCCVQGLTKIIRERIAGAKVKVDRRRFARLNSTIGGHTTGRRRAIGSVKSQRVNRRRTFIDSTCVLSGSLSQRPDCVVIVDDGDRAIDRLHLRVDGATG